MANPFYADDLQPTDYAAFTAEYEDWLSLLRASFDENVSRTRSGGQGVSESDMCRNGTLGPREDRSQKARRVARLARRLVSDAAADYGLARAAVELAAGRRGGRR